MTIPQQSSTPWKVCITFFHIAAISTTVLRLYYRQRQRRLWQDDFIMLPVVIMDMIATVVVWFLYFEGDHSSSVQKVVYWSASLSWFTIIWLTRISLILSVARIIPVWGTIRRGSRGIAVAFGIGFVGLLSWLCTSSCARLVDGTTEHATNILDCNAERRALTITNFVFDIMALSAIIMYPILILTNIPLRRGQHYLATALMASCGSVLLVSIMYCVLTYSPSFMGPGRQLLAGMLSEMETAFSVIACNTLVLVAYIRRHKPDGMDDRIESSEAHYSSVKRELHTSGAYSLEIILNSRN